MTIRAWHPLSLTVLLVETTDGLWRLSDGRRYSKAYGTFEEALGDKETFRRLTYGEPLK